MSEIEIIEGDVLDIPATAFASVQTLIVDPPYSDHVHENMASHGSNGRGSRPRKAGFEALTPELRQQVVAIMGKVSRWSLVFTDFEGANRWPGINGSLGCAEYVRWIPWVRWSQPQLSGDRPPSGAEVVLHWHAIQGRKRWNGPGSLTHYARRCLRGADKHPTEKPLDLLLDMVSWYSDPGETVADVCAGVGTTAVACRLLGRDCIAIERNLRERDDGTIDRAPWVDTARGRLGSLTDRDRDRAEEWCITTHEEASGVPAPKAADGSDVKTWERAQRRLADVERVAAWL